MTEPYSDYPPMYRPALYLLVPLWRGLEPAYKQKYARNIWEQFESNIKAAAYTSSLSKFYNNLCSRLEIVLTANDLSSLFAAITADDEKRLLRQLRDETATLVLMVRLENEKRKEEWKTRQEAALAETRETVARSIETDAYTEIETGGLWS